MRGKLIVFEGIDASGKATQQRFLAESLQAKGFHVESLDFPRYSEFFGSVVGRYLAGEFGSLNELPVEFAALVYSIDRYQMKKEIGQKLAAGTILVANRYVFSNIAFQSAKFKNEKEKIAFWNWLEGVEERMPEADLVFLLDLPVSIAVSLMDGKDRQKAYRNGKERDLHENNEDFLGRVRQNYVALAKKNKNWKIINCVSSNSLRSKGEIAEEILGKTKKLFQ